MPRAAKNVLKSNAMQVKKAVAKDGKPTEYRIEGEPGLVLLCQPSGSARWYHFYSVRIGTKNQRRKLLIGDRDAVTLADAKKKCLRYRNAIDIDDADPAREQRDQAKGITFRKVAEEFLTTDRLAPSTKGIYRYSYAAHVYPIIGDLPIAQVTRDHVLQICRDIEKKGKLIQSDRTKSYIGGAFKYAINQGYVEVNPTAGIGKRAISKPRKQTPTEDELVEFYWNGPDKPGVRVSPPMRDIIRLSLLTGTRRAEAAAARIDEFRDLDGPEPTWVLKGDEFKKGRREKGRTKNAEEHTIRLSTQAVDLVKSVIAAYADDKYLFPARIAAVKIGKKPRTPHIHPQSVTTAIRRMRQQLNIDNLTLHDIRRGVSNWMKDNGIDQEVRNLVENHKGQSVDDLHYSNTANMPRQVRDAMQAWGDHVENLVNQRQINTQPEVTSTQVQAAE